MQDEKGELAFEALMDTSFDNPIQFLRKFGSMGALSIKTIVLIIFSISTINFILLILALWRATVVITPFNASNIGIALLVLLLGIAFTVFAGYRVYQYAVMQAMKFAYTQIRPAVQSLSLKMVTLIRSKTDQGTELAKTSPQFMQVINVKDFLSTNYARIPGIVRRGLVFVFNRLPILPLINELRMELLGDTPEQAATLLHGRIDGLVAEIFDAANLKWLWWLIPLNVAVQALLIWVVMK